MTKTTIDALEAAPVAGNFYQDNDLWSRVDAFMLTDAPMAEKIRALAIIDRITGESGPPTPDAVREYVAMVRDNMEMV